MIEQSITIGCILGLLLRSTDDGHPLYPLKEKWSYICPKWLRKPTIDCDECRSLWLSVLFMILTSSYFGQWKYIAMIPTTMFVSYVTHKIYNS